MSHITDAYKKVFKTNETIVINNSYYVRFGNSLLDVLQYELSK